MSSSRVCFDEPPRARRIHANWSAERDMQLAALWAEGFTASEIARRMDTSKNAVIGRVHRLRLPKRNSPLHRPKKPAPPTIWTFHNIGFDQCRFPDGDPKDKEFHLCGEPVIEGKPYCATHCDLAYHNPVRIGERFKLDNLGLHIK